MTQNGKWMWLSLLATLGIGIGIGIFADRVVLERAVHSDNVEAARASRDDRHENRARKFRDHLRDELSLSQAQTEELEIVLDRNHETARAFWEASRSEFDTLRQQFRRDIRDLLNEEQKARFDELLAERDRARKRRE